MTETQTAKPEATAGYTLVLEPELTRKSETFQFATREQVEDFLSERGATRGKQGEIFSRGRIEVGYTLYTLTGPGVRVPVEYGARRMSYTLTPKSLSGRDINHGWAYWNCDTEQEALASAREAANGRCEGVQVGSVEIVAREVEFRGDGWHQVPGGYFSVQRVERTEPIEYDKADLAKTCRWNSALEDTLHETRADGSCACGRHPSRYAAPDPRIGADVVYMVNTREETGPDQAYGAPARGIVTAIMVGPYITEIVVHGKRHNGTEYDRTLVEGTDLIEWPDDDSESDGGEYRPMLPGIAWDYEYDGYPA